MTTPHANQPVRYAGTPLAEATGAIVLLHGRGASAEDILGLGAALIESSAALAEPSIALAAPQAAGHTWYPNSFLAPREQNEPYLSSSLAKVASVVAEIEAAGIARNRIVIAGFSQGACLTTEFIASNPARYAGAIVFTGGLIGPLGMDLHHEGALEGTPVLMMSGDPDPHVPWQRVEDSARELNRMGAVVEAIRYPGRPHTVSMPEVEHARKLLAKAFAA